MNYSETGFTGNYPTGRVTRERMRENALSFNTCKR